MQISQYTLLVPRAALLAACLLLASFALPARAQNTQTQGTVFKAYLQADKEGGKALANAQISADGAGADVSGSDGLFVLKFTGKKPGEKISLQISKPGWRVLHPIMVDRLLPATQEVPEKILLCQEAQCDALVLEYFSSKAIFGIKLEYEKRIAALKGEGKGQTQGQLKAKDEQIAALQKERDELLAKARDAAAQLARVPQGAVSNAYFQAMEQFRNGHIQQALALLKDEEMSALEAKNKQEREEMINSRLLKGKLQVLSGQYDAAQLQYETALQIDTPSYETWFDYAYFLNQQRQITKAISAYESCLPLARARKEQYEVAAVLNNLAMLYDNDNRLPAALAAYEEALKIRHELAAQNRATYLPDVAMTLNNLGILHYKENRLPAALAAFDEALKIKRELAAQNRAAYLPTVATTLHNLGTLHNKENRLPAALAAYEEALKIRRELAAQNRAAYLPDVAATLHNLGRSHRADKPTAALLALEEAQEQWHELAAGNANAFAPSLADTFAMLGYLHASQQRPAQARKAYEQALAIYRQFLSRNPAFFADRIAKLEKRLTQLPP